MTVELSPEDIAKFTAAKRASALVQPDMVVGLGTGSTAAWLVRCLAQRVQDEGLQFQGVATSLRTADLARELGLNIITLDQTDWLDLTIDGADEIDGELNLIKGGGGALLQEKIVAAASDRMVVIADPNKHVSRLGGFHLPVEVLGFGMQSTKKLVDACLLDLDVAGRETAFRMQGSGLYVTDEENHILDLHLGQIGDVRQLGVILNQIPGVVENGLFVDICDMVITGHEDGRVVVCERGGMPRDEGILDINNGSGDNLFADLPD